MAYPPSVHPNNRPNTKYQIPSDILVTQHSGFCYPQPSGHWICHLLLLLCSLLMSVFNNIYVHHYYVAL